MAPKKTTKKKSQIAQSVKRPTEILVEGKVIDSDEHHLDEDEDEDTDPADADPSDELNETTLPIIKDTDSLPAAVSPNDPLRRYLDEIRRVPLLEPEAEIALVKQMIEHADIEAAKKLVQANLRLVVRIAFEYQNIYSNLMDLIQEGNIGLMKGVSKYDPTKGARLGYYASWWIRSYILKYILDNFRLIRVGTTQAQKKLFFHLMREKEKLEAQGIVAAPKLLAERLQVKEKEVVEMERRLSASGQEFSLDTPISNDSEGRSRTWIETIEDSAESPDRSLEHQEWLKILTEKIPDFEKNLNDKERVILHQRLLAEEPETLQEIGNRYKMTRERARQIEAQVIQKLRSALKDYID